MRVVVAPDSFGGTLSATAAAEAIAAGWRRTAPSDELVLLPLADGGTGFVDVLHAARGGTRHALRVTGPLGEPVTASWLELDGTGYVEAAAACGLHLVPPERRTPATARRATTRGVGELLAAVRDAGLGTAVVGLGGTATTDGGAGMLAALGAVPVDAAGAPLPDGAPAGCVRLAGEPELGGLRLVAAADVDTPLRGRHGAAAVFGPQKGADPAAVAELDAVLTAWADVLAALGARRRAGPGGSAAGPGATPGARTGADPVAGGQADAERAVDAAAADLGVAGAATPPARGTRAAPAVPAPTTGPRTSPAVAGLPADVRDEPGAGAAGGLGAALLACGARRVPGAGLVRELVGLDTALDRADLVLTGEGSFDWQSLRGKLVTTVARGAADRGVPCLVLAGQVAVGRREAAAVGVDDAYSAADHAGGVAASLADPAGALAALAAHVAARWSR